MKQPVKTAAVVGHQGEEHCIRLPLGGGAVARIVVDDADLVVQEFAGVIFPE
jgi:hypothetical protein